MKEVFGDLWEFDGIIAITTNGFLKRDRTCVMGRGCARQAAVRFRELPRKLASRISAEGNHVFYFPEYRLITFPVKHNWWEAADLGSNREIRKRTAENHRSEKDQGSRLPPPARMRQRSAKMGGCEENPLANPQVGSIPHRDLQQNRFVENYPGFSLQVPPRRPRADSK